MHQHLGVVLFGIFIAATVMYVFQAYQGDFGNFLSFESLTLQPSPPDGGVSPDPEPLPQTPTPPSELPTLPPPGGEVVPPVLPDIPQSELPPGFSREDVSPYYHKVRFGYFAAGNFDFPGSLALHAAFDTDERITITGWEIRGRNSGQFIPKAVDVYNSLGTAAETDIYFRKGESLVIFMGIQNPLGVNYRPNQCMGYLQINKPIDPPLPIYCPVPDPSVLRSFSSICFDYALSIGACVEPDSNPPVPEGDVGCRAYLKNFNFASCFAEYLGDPNFLFPEWRVYTQSKFLDPRHDTLLLLDGQGRLVDRVEY